MSIKVSTRVWEYSNHRGSELLALLAISDHADDDGIAWPGVSRISFKARVSERQGKRVIQKLVESGELYVETGGGRGHTNLYFVVVGLEGAEIAQILIERFDMDEQTAIDLAQKLVESQELKGDADVTLSQKRVTSRVKRVTSGVGNGDMAMSPESLEPPEQPSNDENHHLPTALDGQQRAVDQANGKTSIDPVTEVASHIRWLCVGPSVPLPGGSGNKPYLKAARALLEDTNRDDWHGVCFAIDDWSENPPEEDEWRRDRAKEPHYALKHIAAHYFRLQNKPEPELTLPCDIPDLPEPDPLLSWWHLQLALLNPAWQSARPVSKENGKLIVQIEQPGPRAHLSLPARLEAAIEALDGVEELEVVP